MTANKFRAIKTIFNGFKYASKFEATVAYHLEIKKKSSLILGYDNQFKVEMWAYDRNGNKALKLTHRVDFRVHNLDGSFTLLEAKGVETADYKMRKRWLHSFWLPFNTNYDYHVVYKETISKGV